MSHAVMRSSRYAIGRKGTDAPTHAHTHTHARTAKQSILWHYSKTEVDLIHCGNDRVKQYMRHSIEFWCWDFSALTALSVSPSLSVSPAPSLASPLTSLHPLPHHMPKATTINMIGPPHKRRRAIIWTGMTRGKWNWFRVYRSVWVYICVPRSVYICACVCVCVKIVFRFFHQVWAVWQIWEAMACRTERFLPSLVTVAKETNTGSPLLLT